MSAEPSSVARAGVVVFTVLGLPIAQGSKSAIRQGPRTLIVERGRATLRPWQALVAGEAAIAIAHPLPGPVAASLVFKLPRPKSHYRGGAHAGELKPSAPAYVSTRPDVDKLARAILDALTGIAYLDDAQVAELRVTKLYGLPLGVEVTIEELD